MFVKNGVLSQNGIIIRNMKKLGSYFFQGVLLVAPVAIIIYILYTVFVTVDGWLASNLKPVIGVHIPGLGIVILVVSLTILGFIGQTALVSPIKRLGETFIKQIPLLNLLYTSLKDLFSAFVGNEKKFNVPVKVHFNKENNLWKLGFITKDSLDEFELKDMTAVYFPHSYNFSGELYLVPAERVEKLSISPAEVMKFVVSGGVTRISQLNE
ncbi:DUF502 domain-containing protein [Maribellus luteus]|uniref:DUF502 domain-containing protein n=2 Tax=Maribellus luteus TaxID=2305463 RepID=A0A399SY46_9BACT|nr:DUF502 domain-containing protein [Maribellus luteus]